MSKDKKDYYEILKVDKNAESEEIRRAYLELSKKYQSKKNNNKLDELKEAYDTLYFYEKRKEYDEKCQNSGLNKEKVKNIVIIVLVAIILFGGSYSSSVISSYKRDCNKEEDENPSVKFQNIDIVKYLSLLNGEDLSLIFIGREDCSFSAAENLVFQELLEEYEIEVNYLDLDTLSSIDFELLISNSGDNIAKDNIGTPTLMLVQNNEVKMFKKGYVSKSELLDLFKENGFIE